VHPLVLIPSTLSFTLGRGSVAFGPSDRHPVSEGGRLSMGADQTEAFDQAAIRRRERPERPDRATDKPVIDVWGGPGRMSRESFRELWDFREVLSAFVTRQVKVRYKQAAIGIGWVVLQPLLAAAIFAVFLGHLSNVSSEGVPYLLFALTGTAGWSFFSSALSTASDSLVRDQGLLRKL